TTRVPVTVELIEAEGAPFEIEYLRTARPPSVTPRPEAYLRVLQGRASVQSLQLSADRVYMGRIAEVRQTSGAIIRREDMAFEESETSVSRKHAWVQFDQAAGRFRVFNDPESSRGTQVLRGGDIIHSDSVRGVELRDGDEIRLGDAAILFHCGVSR